MTPTDGQPTGAARARVAVVLRKAQRRVSIADEHDAERIAAYCAELGPPRGLEIRVVEPRDRPSLNAQSCDVVLYVGADEDVRARVSALPESTSASTFMWAKGYDLTIDPRWAQPLHRLTRFFNSSFLTGSVEPWNARTTYMPTAFHDPWPPTWRERWDALTNRRAHVDRFDLVFSGSDRHVREDRYRQRLLNRLAAKGLSICVAAPVSVWNRPHSAAPHAAAEALDPRIRVLGNWGTPGVFSSARAVLDLPWLDNHFHTHPVHQRPNESVYALGWNIFRAGAYGACVWTYECPANRALGLSEDHAGFYRTGLDDLEGLADEIESAVARQEESERMRRRANIRTLFFARHTYRHRWAFMLDEVAAHVVH